MLYCDAEQNNISSDAANGCRCLTMRPSFITGCRSTPLLRLLLLRMLLG